jgi:hypothetical protein
VDGTAVSGRDYVGGSGSLDFTAADSVKTVILVLSNDTVLNGTREFAFSLSGPGGGGALGSPAAATIRIVDDEVFGTGDFLDIRSPAQPPAHGGQLSFELSPLEARGQWHLQGDTNWYDSGYLLTNLPAGVQLVEFKTVSGGWLAPDNRRALVGGDQLTSLGGAYEAAAGFSGTTPGVLTFATVSQSAGIGLPYGFNGQIRTELGYGSGVVVQEKVTLTAGHVLFNDVSFSYVTNAQWLFQRDAWPAGEYEPVAQVPRGFYLLAGYAAQRQAENTPGQSSPASYHLDAAALYFVEPAARGGYGGYLVSTPTNQWLTAAAQKLLVGYPVAVVDMGNRGRMHATTPGVVNFAPLPGYEELFGTTGIQSYGGNSGGPLYVKHSNGNFYPAGIYLGGTAQTVVRALDTNVVELLRRAEISANGGANSGGGGVTYVGIPGPIPGIAIGYLRVNVGPAGAVSGGARWQVSGASTLFNPAELVGMVAGSYTLTFTAVPGYVTPGARSVSVGDNQTNTVTVTYAGALGTLRVTLLPAGAVSAGAAWRVVGETNWTNSAVSRTLAAGNYTVEFKPSNGWCAPTNRVVTLSLGQTNLVAGTYQVSAPVLRYAPGTGLVVAGTPGTSYVIEQAASLPGVWSTNATVTLSGAPTTVPGTAPASGGVRFYRARWLP